MQPLQVPLCLLRVTQHSQQQKPWGLHGPTAAGGSVFDLIVVSIAAVYAGAGPMGPFIQVPAGGAPPLDPMASMNMGMGMGRGR